MSKLQVVTEFDSPQVFWSFLELLVLWGWLFALLSCFSICCQVRKIAKGYCTSREPESREEARSPREHLSKATASTQTTLCTPPSSLFQELQVQEEAGLVERKEKENRATTPEPLAVYSSFRRRGNREMLTRDMVVRALPVMADMEQRLEMAKMRENLQRS